MENRWRKSESAYRNKANKDLCHVDYSYMDAGMKSTLISVHSAGAKNIWSNSNDSARIGQEKW